MASVSTRSEFKKEYMTGYTGHVPTKVDLFGATSGIIQRQILVTKGKSSVYDPPTGEFRTLS